MKKPWVIAVLGLFLAAGGYGALYFGRTAQDRELEQACGPELAWIRKEFQLSDAEFQRVRTLHEAYKPVCAEYCRQIDAKNREVGALMLSATNVTPAIEKALFEAAQLKAQCYGQMLQHFFQVSQTMPAEQGRRYLAWMQSVTLVPTHQTMLPKWSLPTIMSTPSSDAADAQATVRLASGHSASLDELMERHGQALFHYLIRLLNDEAEAADLVQESFVRVYQHCARFDPKQKFSTWLFTIATNLARDRWRWRARRSEVSLDAPRSADEEGLSASIPETRADPGQALIKQERGELVRAAIARLSEDLRVPLVLAEYEQQSHDEIGAILGCSAKAVEMRIYRARKLREALRELVEG